MKQVVVVMLALMLLGGMVGCGPAPMVVPPESAATPAKLPPPPKTSDQARLQAGLTGHEMSASEVADLSDRLLANDYTANDQETMARLELLILKTMKSSDKSHRSTLWRNLGIIHYHQHKYKQARQELQAANEINPKSARTHFYLACLFAHQGQIYEKIGKKRVSRQQFKRAARFTKRSAKNVFPGNSSSAPPSKWRWPASWNPITLCTSRTRDKSSGKRMTDENCLPLLRQ
ncbi:MAG: tetratricopeptide repeat protein [Deltaproteobacteria bacterium]